MSLQTLVASKVITGHFSLALKSQWMWFSNNNFCHMGHPHDIDAISVLAIEVCAKWKKWHSLQIKCAKQSRMGETQTGQCLFCANIDVPFFFEQAECEQSWQKTPAICFWNGSLCMMTSNKKLDICNAMCQCLHHKIFSCLFHHGRTNQHSNDWRLVPRISSIHNWLIFIPHKLMVSLKHVSSCLPLIGFLLFASSDLHCWKTWCAFPLSAQEQETAMVQKFILFVLKHAFTLTIQFTTKNHNILRAIHFSVWLSVIAFPCLSSCLCNQSLLGFVFCKNSVFSCLFEKGSLPQHKWSCICMNLQLVACDASHCHQFQCPQNEVLAQIVNTVDQCR